jgi:hypothetical protein
MPQCGRSGDAARGLSAPDIEDWVLLSPARRGNICAITVGHARDRTEIPSLSYEHISGINRLRKGKPTTHAQRRMESGAPYG